MLTLHNLPGPVPHFHTASIGKLGRVCEQGSITISQLVSNVHVVLIHISNILTAGKDRKRRIRATKPPVKKFYTRQNTGPMPNWSTLLRHGAGVAL